MIKANISWNAKQIAKAVENGSMTFDNAIQRGHVWNREKQILLVDSLLRNFPVPPMYTIKTDIDAPAGCKKGSKVFDCIDGKQRANAMRAFRNNEFALEGCEPFIDNNGMEVDLNGKTYAELDEEWQDTFDGYTLTVYFFTDITDDEIADMMSRLNNGKPLTGVENARIKAKNLAVIRKLANHTLFTENMTVSAMESYHNEDIVIKTALQIFDKQYELSTKNVKNAYESLAFTGEQVDSLEYIFESTEEIIGIIKERANKPVLRKVLKKTNLVAVIYLVSNKLKEDCDIVADFLEEFFGNEYNAEFKEHYDNTCLNGTNHSQNVFARNKALDMAYEEYKDSLKIQ